MAQAKSRQSSPSKKRSSEEINASNINDMITKLDLSKPKNAFVLFMNDLISKGFKYTVGVGKSTEIAQKFRALPQAEQNKYKKLAEEEKERYREHFWLVKKYLIGAPHDESSSAYGIFKQEHIDSNHNNEKVAAKEARSLWDNMTKEQRAVYEQRRQENLNHIRQLVKTSNSNVSGYQVFVSERAAQNAKSGTKVKLSTYAEEWKKLKDSEKKKYNDQALQDTEARLQEVHRKEAFFHIKPRKPIGALKFFINDLKKRGDLKDQAQPVTHATKLFEKLSKKEKDRYKELAHKEEIIYNVKKSEFTSYVRNLFTAPPSARNLFIKENAEKLTSKGGLPKGGFLAFMGQKWDALSDSQKKTYYDRAAKLLKEFNEKRKEFDDRVFEQPSRPKTAFDFFRSEYYKKQTGKGRDIGTLVREAVKEYGKLNDSQKKKYEAAHAEEVKEYERRSQEYAKYGCYNPNHAIGTDALPKERVIPKKERLRSATPKPKKRSSSKRKSKRSTSKKSASKRSASKSGKVTKARSQSKKSDKKGTQKKGSAKPKMEKAGKRTASQSQNKNKSTGRSASQNKGKTSQTRGKSQTGKK